MNHKYLFPMYVDLSEKKVVVIGAGNVAARRVEVLTHFGCDILVIAPQIQDKLRMLEEKKQIQIYQREYIREDLYDADVVLAATDDEKINDEIYSVCKCLGISVNVASNQNKCDFQFPSVIIEEDMVIGINNAGADPKNVKEMRCRLEQFFKHE